MSSKIKLSTSEQQYIINGIHFNHRVDGRSSLDYRDILIETSVLRGTHGSSRIRLGDTELLCGISVELFRVDIPKNLPTEQVTVDENLTPNVNQLIAFKVDCSPNASPDFRGRGGEDIAEEISDTLLKAWSRSENLLSTLEIVKNRFYWKIYADILVLECGGTLLDASSLAVHSALKTTILPKVSIEEGDGFEPEISLIDDEMNGFKLENLDQAPIIITIHKIGQRHVVDPSLEEECCSSASLTVGLSRKHENKYLLVKKSGKKSLSPGSLREMLEAAKSCFAVLNQELNRIYSTKRIKDTNVVSSQYSLGYMVE